MKTLVARYRPELLWLSGLLVVSGFVLVFGHLAEQVVEGDTSAFDRHILLFFRDPVDPDRLLGPYWLPEVIRDITSLGSTVILALVTVLAALYLGLVGKRGTLGFLLGCVVGGQILSTVLKLFFERARPDLIGSAPDVFTASFPSGHAMLSAVTYLTLGALLARFEERRRMQIFWVTVAVFLTVIIGVSRVLLGVHWPTDVMGGWCIGAAWALGCSLLALWMQQRGRIDPPSDPARPSVTPS